MKEKCWEVKRCGREKGGSRVEELGECPAARDRSLDGKNGGENGGRYCWRVAEPRGNKLIPHWCDEERNCLVCEFFRKVKRDEGEEFTP